MENDADIVWNTITVLYTSFLVSNGIIEISENIILIMINMT
jgi:hypothetical protein